MENYLYYGYCIVVDDCDREGERVSIFEDLISKGVYIRFNVSKGNKELVGILVEYDSPLLVVSSRGKKYTINKNVIIEIREALGEVEP